MDTSSQLSSASFWTQADALLRKNLVFQRRNKKTNIRLTFFPLVLCVLLVVLQAVIDNALDKPENKCGCICIDTDVDGKCEKKCGIQYSNLRQAWSCAIPSPPEWPPILQIPAPQNRAVITDFLSYPDLPNESCRRTGSCPASILFTGSDQPLAESVMGDTFPSSSAGDMFPSSLTPNASALLYSVAFNVLGSASWTASSNFLDPAFSSGLPIYSVQSQCAPNSTWSVSIPMASAENVDVTCVQGLPLWRNSGSNINDELYKGYRKGNSERKINEIVAAYDFLNTNRNNFNVSIWYNSTYKNYSANQLPALTRVPRSVNLVSNTYLQYLLGPGTKILFEFVKEMPKYESEVSLDLSSIIGTLFFTWVILQLFPVILVALVYEREHKLRIMMKMHGLGDGPYWLITYIYFLVISALYMLVFVTFGSAIGLKFFTLNDHSIQFVFYLIYINLQVASAFLVAPLFSSVKTAAVLGYLLVFGTGLLGGFLLQSFVEDDSFSRGLIIVMELYPGFSLYRGLYEFGYFASVGNYMRTHGMRWKNLSDSRNGMKEVWIIMFLEWLVFLFAAYYVDQVMSSGRSPLFFLRRFQKKSPSTFQNPNLQRQQSRVFVQMDKPDVMQEREKVEQLLLESTTSHAIISDNLKKVYPGKDGNSDKFAVRGMSLALPHGECFGLLGPNGAGKTSFISMMIGLARPTSGNAYVQGMDICNDMDRIYTSMGVCPQHDLLWDTLTGREHLLFYGRLKNLKGASLEQAVEHSLKNVNLFHGGVVDKQARKYSGGMKRRLSVAISLIGDPKVVYMDEPSTGLDPASRNSLWNVVKRAKQGRAIILTTHSMEEAEHLCDRIGIIVDGSLQCIGNPKELKARYGGSFVFTMTTPAGYEEEVEALARRLSPNANKIYHISGTQKFDLPRHEVKIADVFQAVEDAKSKFTVQAWGLANTTLEDVFINVAREARAFDTLS